MAPWLEAILSGGALSAGLIAIHFFERRSNDQPQLSLIRWAGLLVLLWLFLALVRYFLILANPYLQPLEEWLERYPVYVIAGGMVLAAAPFLLRRRRKDLYGYLEIIIGLTVLTFFAVNPYPGIVAFIVGFATPVYILIRGAVNIDEYKPS
ncbi:MAG TPA: hypothetical protein VF603_11260 [Allosphingosinicella sp.]|jgi:hypothetical protein